MVEKKPLKIVYCASALYMAGGEERVLTLKANYLADVLGYDVTIILTEGKGRPLFYELSDKVKIVNLDINFEELWNCSFIKKILVYLKKQRINKRLLTEELMCLQPDITVSLLRREINFLCDIPDGSLKIGEMHINRANYRSYDGTNIFKRVFSWLWKLNLLGKLRKLDKFVVLTDADRLAWKELDNVVTIPNPLPFRPDATAGNREKRIIVVGRYSYEKGFDLLLQVWSIVQGACPDWRLEVFGDGDREPYEQMIKELNIDLQRCILNGRTSNIQEEYAKSMLSVCTSRFEGFGLVIVEAMACGLPVVAFNCQYGPSSIITDGVDGLLIKNGNVQAMANALISLMSNEEVRCQMSKKALEKVNDFKLENIMERWRLLFEEVCSQSCSC